MECGSVFRIALGYFGNDIIHRLNVASIELILGLLMMAFGLVFGVFSWSESSSAGVQTPTGTVMISVLPLIMGFQLLLNSLHYDITNSPLEPLQECD